MRLVCNLPVSQRHDCETVSCQHEPSLLAQALGQPLQHGGMVGQLNAQPQCRDANGDSGARSHSGMSQGAALELHPQSRWNAAKLCVGLQDNAAWRFVLATGPIADTPVLKLPHSPFLAIQVICQGGLNALA